MPVLKDCRMGHQYVVSKQVVCVDRFSYTVNSLMFTGIVCMFETKPCLRELILAVSSGLVNYLGT